MCWRQPPSPCPHANISGQESQESHQGGTRMMPTWIHSLCTPSIPSLPVCTAPTRGQSKRHPQTGPANPSHIRMTPTGAHPGVPGQYHFDPSHSTREGPAHWELPRPPLHWPSHQHSTRGPPAHALGVLALGHAYLMFHLPPANQSHLAHPVSRGPSYIRPFLQDYKR